jgi:hypothetical protein
MKSGWITSQIVCRISTTLPGPDLTMHDEKALTSECVVNYFLNELTLVLGKKDPER